MVLGALALGTIGAIRPVPPDLTAFSGAVYGFLLGALAGVILDRRRASPQDRSKNNAWPHPVVANGKLDIRDQGVLLCYDVKKK